MLHFIPRPVGGGIEYILLTMFERVEGVLLFSNSPFMRQLTQVVEERRRLRCMAALNRWICYNNVSIDKGGFYSPIPGTLLRVRIGWWERGVRSRKVWDDGRQTYVKEYFALDGFEIY